MADEHTNGNDTLKVKTYDNNAFILGSAFFCVFMAFNTAQTLATSLPGGPANLGYVDLAALYATFTVACFFVPPWISKIGPKWAMIIGSIPYVLMVGATLAPSYYLSVPMNTLVGLGAPLLWTGASVYLGRCADNEASCYPLGDLTKKEATFKKTLTYDDGKIDCTKLKAALKEHNVPHDDFLVSTDGHQERLHLLLSKVAHKKVVKAERATITDGLNTKYNGLFFMPFQGSGTIGLLISSLVLRLAGSNAVRFLFILLVFICGCGVAIMVFIPRVDAMEADAGDGSKSKESSWKDTIHLAFTNYKMALMIPIIFYNGLSLAFIFGDYTSYVVANTWSVTNTGFVMATFYFVNAVATYLASKVAVKYGRRPMLALATIAQIAFWVWMLFWKVPKNYVQQCKMEKCQSNSTDCSADECVDGGYGHGQKHKDEYSAEIHTPTFEQLALIFIGVAVFAIGDSIWESFPQGILQTFFKDDERTAALANSKMWQSLGFALQFALGIVLSDYFSVKITILLAMQCIGAFCLVILHVFVEPLDAKKESLLRAAKNEPLLAGEPLDAKNESLLRAAKNEPLLAGEDSSIPYMPVQSDSHVQ